MARPDAAEIDDGGDGLARDIFRSDVAAAVIVAAAAFVAALGVVPAVLGIFVKLRACVGN